VILSPLPAQKMSHSTAKRVLVLLDTLLSHLHISEQALIDHVEDVTQSTLPANTLRKYIRTIRHAGFKIKRARLRGVPTYTVEDSLFHWAPGASHSQAFEAFMCSLDEESQAFRKWKLLVHPVHRHTCPMGKQGKHSIDSLVSLTRQTLINVITQGIKDERVIEFHLATHLIDQHPAGALWAIPHSITVISPKHVILTCITPYSRRLYYLNLNDVWQAMLPPIEWNASYLGERVSYTLVMSPELAKRYDIKMNETLTIDPVTGHHHIVVSDEAMPIALQRVQKYDTLATVENNPILEERITRFSDLQHQLYAASKVLF